ncbi:MAG: ATP-binding protein [Deltaproteobacteria bacterium]|nr:ATP-binding protein [Deltaproteobacteria bacterium]
MAADKGPFQPPVVLALAWTLILGISLGTQITQEQKNAREHSIEEAEGELRGFARVLRRIMQPPGIFTPPTEDTPIPEGWERVTATTLLQQLHPHPSGAAPPGDHADASLELHRIDGLALTGHTDLAGTLAPILAGANTSSAVFDHEGKPMVHSLAALRAGPGCIRCHSDKREGELLGVILTELPMVRHQAIADTHTRLMLGWHGAVWGIGLLGLALWGRRRWRAMRQHDADQEALLASAQRYQLLVESTQVITWELDLESRRFTYVGPQAGAISGYPAAAWTDLDAWAGMIHPEDRQEAIDTCLGATRRLEDHALEYRMVKPDGTILFVRDIVSVLARESEPVELRGIIIDLTAERRIAEERESLEAHRRRTQRIESLGVLAGGIAHDFNNLLTPILGLSEMTMHELPENSPMRDKLRQVVVAAEQAGDLVRQMLTFSRGEQKCRSPLTLAPLVGESLSFLRASLPANIELERHFPQEPLVVAAEPTEVHQIILNLCTNAAHAIGADQGTIEVWLDRIEDPLEQGGAEPAPIRHSVRLQVRDDGCGMDPSVLDRIFDPFFTTKEGSQGTGLGLSVVHGIVQGLGGRILVDSRPEVGTTFSVMLPLVEGGEQVTASARAAALLPTGQETLLLVDDEPVILAMSRQYLEGLGYKVLSATNGAAALELFDASPEAIDLIVTDQGMPGMTGLELCHELHTRRPELPCILATGYGAGLESHQRERGALAALLEKPFSVLTLARLVREILDGESGGERYSSIE